MDLSTLGQVVIDDESISQSKLFSSHKIRILQSIKISTTNTSTAPNMKLSSYFLPSLFAVAVLRKTAEAACSVNIYQRGDNGSDYGVQSYNHDDGLCAAKKNQVKLTNGEWKSVTADKNGHSTIQNVVRVLQNCKIDGNDDTSCDWNAVNFNTCDGITQKSMCSGSQVYKAACKNYYVFYPAGNKKMCKAVLDSDGNPALNSNGEPYGNCDNCNAQNTRFLRG